MSIDFTPEIQQLVEQAIASGRLGGPEDAVHEALNLWAERERQRQHTMQATDASSVEKARAFEAWARNHAITPPLSDEAIRRENLIRNAQ
jgi:hypothetical protein